MNNESFMRMKNVLAAIFLIYLAGCATGREGQESYGTPAILAPVSYAGVIDGRSDFERITCRINAEHGRQYPDYRDCEDIFSPLGESSTTPYVIPRAYCCFTIVFVPGLFGECVSHLATPFSDSYERLRQHGHDVHVAPVKGRSSSKANGKLISEYLKQRDSQLGHTLLIGYSKGVPDILEALADNHDANWVKKVRAVVSIAGIVSGTPLADRFAGLYDSLFFNMPWRSCDPEDGGGIDSLTRKTRLQFLARHAPPHKVKFFSLVAMPRTSSINPLLFPFYRVLGDEGNNDGQVLVHDAIIPGSTLLGYLNGDHWAVAVPFNKSHSQEASALRLANAFPREVLVDAILEYLAGVLD